VKAFILGIEFGLQGIDRALYKIEKFFGWNVFDGRMDFNTTEKDSFGHKRPWLSKKQSFRTDGGLTNRYL